MDVHGPGHAFSVLASPTQSTDGVGSSSHPDHAPIRHVTLLRSIRRQPSTIDTSSPSTTDVPACSQPRLSRGHVSRLLSKLEAANRVQVALVVHDAGLLCAVTDKSVGAGRSPH